MKVGDLVTMIGGYRGYEDKDKPKGIVVAVDPEEINDKKEVAVVWTSIWCDESNHSVDYLEVISESR